MKGLSFLLALLFLLLFIAAARAQPVDLNIITAIDASGSITPTEEDMQYRGLAQAVVDERFLQRVAEGEFGAVGFAAFTWSANRAVTVIPWTAIRSPEDARAVAAAFDAIPRTTESGQYTSRPADSPYIGGVTNIGESIERALLMLAASPFTAERGVINILSDGKSDDDPSLPRAQAAAQGVTVNGVVFGQFTDDLRAYFEANIVTGTGAFVMEIERPFDVPAVLERKFWQDMVAANRPREAREWKSPTATRNAPRSPSGASASPARSAGRQS